MWLHWTAALAVLAAGVREADDAPEVRRAGVYEARLRVIGPVPGSVIWDRIAVGAELEPGAKVDADARVWLELSDGTRLEAVREVLAGDLVRRHLFELDADAHAAGPLELVAVTNQRDGRPLRSAPVRATVARPEPADLVGGEFEHLVLLERPADFGDLTPRVGRRADASGGAFVAHASTEPVCVLPFAVPETGRYQMMLVARGDFAAGAFPSVGLCVDGPADSRTATRLVDRAWQRLPLGFPVELDAGERILAVRFLNDFHLAGTADRNLYIDRYELLRVADEGPAPAYGAMAMMSAMSSMRASSQSSMDSTESPGESTGEATSDGVRIGLTRALHGLPVSGRLQIDATCRWEGMLTTPAPRVDLILNGRVVATQQASRPRFALDRGAFAAGANTIRLAAALADGRRGSTPEEVVHVERAPEPSAAPRDLHRFSVVDERWDDAMRSMLDGVGEEDGHRVAVFTDPDATRLALPPELEGEFEVLLEARGPRAPLAALIDVSLEVDGETRSIGTGRVHDWWALPGVGTVKLERGSKSLALALADGSHEPTADEERPLVRGVLLRTHRPQPDRGAPSATVLYPPPGHVARGVDAVVVSAWDDEDRLANADVWIDGVAQGTHGHVPDGAGYVVLPLILRHVAPGEHALSVRVEDREGNLGESLEIPFVAAADAPDELGPYRRAVRLLSRFAYGPEPQQLAEVLLEGERAWLARQLAERGAGDHSAHAFALAQMRDLYDYAVARAALQHAIGTRNPVWTRFAWWTENHFSTWIRKSGGGPEWAEHEAFLRLGPTSFRELLAASATSPAMLVYLDQRESYAGRLNENYARELLELHTVGVDGGYDQGDVTELAGLLAGATLVDQAPLSGSGGVLTREFRYAPELGDGGEVELLGQRFEPAPADERWGRFERVLDLLAERPETARLVATELAEHYVAVPAPEALVEDLARVFTDTAGDLRAVLLALAEHEAFLDPELPSRVMNPTDYGLRLARVAGNPQTHWGVHNYVRLAGMGCFDRATPDGYPEEDAAWTGTNATMQRWALPRDVQWAAGNLVPAGLRTGSGGDVDAWRQRVIDVVAVGFTGDVLGEASNRAALDYFETLDAKPWEQVGPVAVLVCQMPEAGLK